MSALPRYVVHFTYVPEEALWVTCASHKELLEKVALVWGTDLQPIVKYFLPSHVEQGSCEVLIDDEHDFAIWKFGTGTSEAPQPLTQSLYVFDRRRLPCVRRKEEYGGMFLFPTIGFDMLAKSNCTFALRHSASKDLMLFGRDDVSGGGCNEWGRLVVKARAAWGVTRPVFRYLDSTATDTEVDCDTGKRHKVISIYTPEDFRLWSSYRKAQQPELYVFEGASMEQLLDSRGSESKPLGSVYIHHEVVLPPSSSTDALTSALGMVDALQRVQSAAATETAAAVARHQQRRQELDDEASRRSTRLPRREMSEHEEIVWRGDFGPPMTTPATVDRQRELRAAANREAGEQHHALLRQRLARGY